MLPVVWLVAAVLVAVVVSMWVTFTLTRLDRLHARVDAARAALDAQLVRRAATVRQVAEPLDATSRSRYEATARAALAPGTPEDRQVAENHVGQAVTVLAADPALDDTGRADLRESAARVQVARRFYNDAVRDTRVLRGRRMPRLLHLAGRVALPEYFDIDDTLPAEAPAPDSASGTDDRPPPTSVTHPAKDSR